MRDFSPTLALRPQRFQFADDAYGGSGLRSGFRRPFTDAEEMELALELLEVTSEAELEQFLGNLFKKAWRGIKRVGSKVIGPLGGLLKTVAKKALPFVATAAGTFFGGPVGGAIGGKLGSLVGQALEVEAAGMAGTDRDLEKCRQFVRMAGQAASVAASAPPGANPVALAQKVLEDSARKSRVKIAGPAAKAAPRGKASDGIRAAPAPSPTDATLKKSETRNPVAMRRHCAACGKSAESCSCGKVGQGGGWIRSGRTIIVNA
jgi:hypothetical protein